MQNFRDRISVQNVRKTQDRTSLTLSTIACVYWVDSQGFGFGFEIAELSDLPYYRYL